MKMFIIFFIDRFSYESLLWCCCCSYPSKWDCLYERDESCLVACIWLTVCKNYLPSLHYLYSRIFQRHITSVICWKNDMKNGYTNCLAFSGVYIINLIFCFSFSFKVYITKHPHMHTKNFSASCGKLEIDFPFYDYGNDNEKRNEWDVRDGCWLGWKG